MTITAEIDNINRFNNKSINDKDKTRIKFENIEYFILPLIMFKRFHIQFDGTNKIISFYTTDTSILQLKKDESINNDNNNNNNNISTALLICIIIIVVLVILIIGFVIYIFMRRKNKELTIKNDIKKIEDIEEFHSLE